MKQYSIPQVRHENLDISREAEQTWKGGSPDALSVRRRREAPEGQLSLGRTKRSSTVAIDRNALEISVSTGEAASAKRTLRVALPRLPSDVPDEEGTTLGTLSTVLLAYHEVVPEPLRDEYIRRLMKFAGEQAGVLLRMSIAHAGME